MARLDRKLEEASREQDKVTAPRTRDGGFGACLVVAGLAAHNSETRA